MLKVKLGKTGIEVNKNGFGALPIQRASVAQAALILKKAYVDGINFYDTARFYTDSEEKIGRTLGGVREKIIIASKTMAQTPEQFNSDLRRSLMSLGTDYIDIYQFHNPSFCPKPGDGSGLYEAMQEAKLDGKIRHIGITNHRIAVAEEAVESGLYATLQFPFSYLSGERELELVNSCTKKHMGFIAMKALGGGLITNARLAYAFMAQHKNVLPIWGIQKMSELEEFLSFQNQDITISPLMGVEIENDKKQLGSEFCRGCGYCMPCPAGIEINNCARMSLMLRRAPAEAWLSEDWQAKMAKIDECTNCGQCKAKCPYGLDTPELLKKNLADYRDNFINKKE